MVHSIEHLVVILIIILGAVHAGTAVSKALTELLEALRKSVEGIRKIWDELKKF